MSGEKRADYYVGVPVNGGIYLTGLHRRTTPSEARRAAIEQLGEPPVISMRGLDKKGFIYSTGNIGQAILSFAARSADGDTIAK